MKIMKRLMLTGLTTWSLGIGTAMAQDGGMGQSYWADQWLKTHQQTAPNLTRSTGTVRSFWYRGDSIPANEGPGLAGGGG